MKKLVSAFLALSLMLTAAACTSGTDNPSSTTNAGGTTSPNGTVLTIKEGVLQVGMEMTYPPMEYMDTDGATPIGFDVEFAKALGEELGLKVELVDTAWDGIFASLDSNRYDCVISAVSITPDRIESYNLSKPYVANKLCIVTSKNLGIKEPKDLAGHSVGVQTDTTSDHYMVDLIKSGVEVKADSLYRYDSIMQCFEELKNGRLDAVMVDSVVAAYYIGEDSDKFSIVWENDEAEPMAICMKKGNDVLTEKINAAIDSLYASGKVREIAEKYFGSETNVGVQ